MKFAVGMIVVVNAHEYQNKGVIIEWFNVTSDGWKNDKLFCYSILCEDGKVYFVIEGQSYHTYYFILNSL